MPWVWPFKNCIFFTFQILTAVLWMMQVFWYLMLQSVMFWSITAQRPTLLNLDGEGATVLWNAPTMTPLTPHHIHKTWTLTFQSTIHQYWYHQLHIITYCQKVNCTRKKFQKLTWNLKEFIPKQVKQLAVCASMQCRQYYEVCMYIYLIILQWCGADGSCSLQLAPAHMSQFRNMNSTETDFSVSQNCKTFAQVMTNLIWI